MPHFSQEMRLSAAAYKGGGEPTLLTSRGLGKIAGPVIQLQVRFLQHGIDDLNLDAPVGAVSALVCR